MLGFLAPLAIGAGKSLLGGLFKPKTQTQTQTGGLDPATQRYVDAQRGMGQAGANVALNQPGSFFTGPQQMSVADQAAQFFNPYQDQVLGAMGQQYDHLRAGAMMGANQQATQAGAFGGSRHGVMAGARLGELDRAQMGQTADLLSGGYQQALQQGTQYAEMQRQLQQQQMQEPLWRQQQAMQMMNLGMGPAGYQNQQTSPGGSRLGGAAGGALAGWGATMNPETGQGNKWGAILGGLGGLFS